MITSLKGRILKKSQGSLILECSGVGYQIFISKKLSENIAETGEEVFVLTYLDVKENAMTLYGFFDEKEREIFKLLITVSGISSKSAHNILLYVGFEEIIALIMGRKTNSNLKIPGIGAKKMEIISTTLKDKILKLHTDDISDIQSVPEIASGEQTRLEALTALMTLGYSRGEAERLIREVLKYNRSSELSTEDLIKKSLELTS
ncbi:MAG: Holliday junction branch migration protein RuvA [Ignavibacteria bacterium]|nr:Holliday junction branch migration protein RuvA [Ignavibacteria bacterium]